MEIKNAINKSINKIKEIGLYAKIDSISLETSYYIGISEKEATEYLFIIRMSDHDLKNDNYLPAGVINYSYCSNDSVITKEEIIDYYNEVKNMDEEELKELWTNRYIDWN